MDIRYEKDVDGLWYADVKLTDAEGDTFDVSMVLMEDGYELRLGTNGSSYIPYDHITFEQMVWFVDEAEKELSRLEEEDDDLLC